MHSLSWQHVRQSLCLLNDDLVFTDSNNTVAPCHFSESHLCCLSFWQESALPGTLYAQTLYWRGREDVPDFFRKTKLVHQEPCALLSKTAFSRGS